jgi:hypothetical protein
LVAGFGQSWAGAHPGLPGSKAYEAKVAKSLDIVQVARAKEMARAEEVAPVEVQEALLEATARDDVAAVGVILGGRCPGKMRIDRVCCPSASMWTKRECWSVQLLPTAVFMRARGVTRFLLGFFEVEVDFEVLLWAVVSGDEELMRSMWVRMPEAIRGIAPLTPIAAEFGHDLVFRWLIGFANESELAIAAAMCGGKHFARGAHRAGGGRL